MRTTFGSATSPGEIATHFGAGRSAMPAVFDACLRPAVYTTDASMKVAPTTVKIPGRDDPDWLPSLSLADGKCRDGGRLASQHSRLDIRQLEFDPHELLVVGGDAGQKAE